MEKKRRGLAGLPSEQRKEIASKGGKARTGAKGFALMSPEQRREAGSRGGKKSVKRSGKGGISVEIAPDLLEFVDGQPMSRKAYLEMLIRHDMEK